MYRTLTWFTAEICHLTYLACCLWTVSLCIYRYWIEILFYCHIYPIWHVTFFLWNIYDWVNIVKKGCVIWVIRKRFCPSWRVFKLLALVRSAFLERIRRFHGLPARYLWTKIYEVNMGLSIQQNFPSIRLKQFNRVISLQQKVSKINFTQFVLLCIYMHIYSLYTSHTEDLVSFLKKWSFYFWLKIAFGSRHIYSVHVISSVSIEYQHLPSLILVVCRRVLQKAWFAYDLRAPCWTLSIWKGKCHKLVLQVAPLELYIVNKKVIATATRILHLKVIHFYFVTASWSLYDVTLPKGILDMMIDRITITFCMAAKVVQHSK